MTIEIDELLKPAVEAFKSRAQSAIDAETAKMAAVLRVRYKDADQGSIIAGLPTPRLQFRWENRRRPDSSLPFTCWYEMVFALKKHDIRNDDEQGYGVIELGSTAAAGGNPTPWENGNLCDATPFRDGAHASWDAEQFGGWPVYVIAPDGRYAIATDHHKQGEAK